MFVRRSSATLLRAGVLWLGSAATSVALLRLSSSALAACVRGGTADFEQLLVAVCAVVATASSTVVLTVTSGVVRDLLSGRSRPGGCAVRRMVLTACGIAVVSTASTGVAQAAPHASPHQGPHSVAGLPLPDRAAGGPHRIHARPAGAVVRVSPGDSLWSIAADRLGPGASDHAIAAYSRRIGERNAATIGPDPDHILPGQTLHLPRVQE